MRILPGLITSADPALAAERAAEQRARRSVYVGDHADGGSMLFARLDTEDALALNHTITQIAHTLLVRGNAESLDARRATALGMLADPHAALDFLDHDGDGRPTNRVTTLMVHIAGDCHALNMLHTPHRPYRPSERGSGCPGSTRCTCGGGAPVTGGVKTPITCVSCTCGTATPCPTGCPVDEASVARVDGIGAFDLTTLGRVLDASSKVIVRPVVDWNTFPAVDAYEVPDRLREAITSRNPTDVFPYSARRADRCDMDHTIAYDHDAPPGSRQTRPDNLGPLSRRPHRAKTSRAWHVRQTDPSVYIWTSPHGFRYEVNPQGTIPLGRPTPPRADDE